MLEKKRTRLKKPRNPKFNEPNKPTLNSRIPRLALNMAVGAGLLASHSGFAQADLFPEAIELGNLNGIDGMILNGEAARDYSGSSVSGVGDINGDGIDDLVIGARGADPNGIESGRSYVIFGSTSTFSSPWDLSEIDGSNGVIVNGVSEGDFSGVSVSAAGDFNGDGVDDLIIGAPLADPSGLTTGAGYILYGSEKSFPRTLELGALNGKNGLILQGDNDGDYAGISVAAAGDINGDGIDDVILGATRANANTGHSYVVFGSTSSTGAVIGLSTLDGSNGFILIGENDSDYSGNAVSGAGDINGDGIDDLVIGAYGADPNGNESGRSYVVFGTTAAFDSVLNLASLNGENGFALNGEQADDRSGFSLSSAGDINGDGIDDLIIGSHPPNDFYGGGQSRSYVVFGSVNPFIHPFELSTLDGDNGFIVNGEDGTRYSGVDVSAAGDVNGDGIDDLLIGDASAGPNGPRSGRAYVLFGSTTPFNSPVELSSLDGQNGFFLNGETEDDKAGLAVSSAGDINADGVSDLALGAFGADSNGDYSGRSYVVYGRKDGLFSDRFSGN